MTNNKTQPQILIQLFYTLPSPNDKPVDMLGLSLDLETPLEELAFPWLFPFGVNG